MYGYFGENGPQCEKDVKKINPLLPPMKYDVYFKRRKVKRYLKIAGAKEKPTRARHLSTFPHPGSGQQRFPHGLLSAV